MSVYSYTEREQQQQQLRLRDPSSPMAVTSYNTHSPLLLLGPENTVTECPFCRATVKTAIRYTSTTRTFDKASSFCFLASCLFCFPYCSAAMKNTDHYCPNCQRYLGTYYK